MIIYKVKNLINDKVYIGKTIKSLSQRKKEHFKVANKGSKCIFHNALRKYGFENFKFSILRICDSAEKLNEKEKTYIIKYKTITPYGYNMTYGGDGFSDPSGDIAKKISKKLKGVPKPEEFKQNLRKPWTEERKQKLILKGRKPITEKTRKKLSEANKGRVFTEEWKQKISEANKGRVFTEEWKQKIGEKSKGRIAWNKGLKGYGEGNKHSEETKKKISEAHKGRKLSKEHKEKLRLAHLGKKLSEEHKIKIGLANLGQTRSDETRKNISNAKKGYKHSDETKQKIRLAMLRGGLHGKGRE